MASLLKSHRYWVLAMLWAEPALATSIEMQVTPTNTRLSGLAFQVVTRDVGEGVEVEVLVQVEAGRELSPLFAAVLEVHEGDRLVISCPVEKRQEDGEERYPFYVSRQDVGTVRFRFKEYAFSKVVGKDGSVRILGMPSVTSYWLNLGDFVADRAVPVPPATTARLFLIGVAILGTAFVIAVYRGKRRRTSCG